MKKKPKPERPAYIMVRLDRPLKLAFDQGVASTGESAASVIRGLVREFVKRAK